MHNRAGNTADKYISGINFKIKKKTDLAYTTNKIIYKSYTGISKPEFCIKLV